MIHFGPDIEALLRQMPTTGPLFPYLQSVRCGDPRHGVSPTLSGAGNQRGSLHSLPLRLGGAGEDMRLPGAVCARSSRNTTARPIHRAYARKAQVRLPSLESYEKQNVEGRIVPLLPRLPKPEANGHSFSAAG